MNEAISAFSIRNGVGQLALRRKVAGDVLIVRGSHLQVDTETFMRIKNTNSFSELAANGIYCAHLICVSCKKEETVGHVQEGVKHDGNGEIDI